MHGSFTQLSMEYWQEVPCDDTKWESHVEEELKPAKTIG